MIPVLIWVAGLQSGDFVEKLPNSTIEFKMVAVPGGKVKVGEKTVDVKPFHIGATEVTWDVFDQFLLSGEPSKPYDTTQYAPETIARPSRSYILPDLGWGHRGYPVINVSSTNVDMFLRWLRSVTKKKYRLPTEAEWQFAAQGGPDFKPLTKEEAAKREWFADNSDSTTKPVGKKAPNALGLYDILGNVGEWAIDMNGKPVLCGGDIATAFDKLSPSDRRYHSPDWQVSDPQLPKSRWWLADGWFVGFRVACEG